MPNANFVIAYSAAERYRFSRYNDVIQAGMSEIRTMDTYIQTEKKSAGTYTELVTKSYHSLINASSSATKSLPH